MGQDATTLKQAPEVLTIQEAAAILRISRGSAYEAARRGELPVIRIGRRLLVSRVALERLLQRAGVGHDCR
ncbi:MAG: helix-turn-helix domain-containing protein [Thermoleophilia bacterium]|nr:helix-turn-helix domain-containing protein [Thermoleophilia bacterium]